MKVKLIHGDFVRIVFHSTSFIALFLQPFLRPVFIGYESLLGGGGELAAGNLHTSWLGIYWPGLWL
jgi:hypothetical protein